MYNYIMGNNSLGDDWITTAEAVIISGYHPERIRELLREGKIVGQKFGPVWQINRGSILKYLRIIEKSGKRRGPKRKKE
jgi:hypothetical protein